MASPNSLTEAAKLIELMAARIRSANPDATIEHALLFCITNGIIRRLTLRNILILMEYHELRAANKDWGRGRIYSEITDKFPVKMRQLQNIIYYQAKTFKQTYNVVP